MPAIKRQRRSSPRHDAKRARTRQGRRPDRNTYAAPSSLHPWRYLRDLLSLWPNKPILPLDALSKPWRSLTRLLELPQRWMPLLGGVSAAEEIELPGWCATQDITFEILEYLDPASLACLSASCRGLRPSVKTYALHVVRHRYADIPVGFASHAVGVGMLNQSPHLGALPLMAELAPHLMRQRLFQPRSDSLETVQSAVLARGFHITRHMRTVLVDWMIEVASEYRLTPVCLHASVNLMDRCLSRFATPRHRLQLLGVCCLMLESQRAPGYAMTIHDVCYISDSQYNDFEVVAMYNIVTGNTQAPVTEQSAETVQDFLSFFLSKMGLQNLTGAEAPAIGEIAEDVILCNLLADLSLLDYHMLRFHPSTIAGSLLLYSRLLLHHFSSHRLSITSMGILTKAPREVLALCHYRRPYVEKSAGYESQPFGVASLGLFMQSYEAEALATAFCVAQLWRLHCDFLFHTCGIGNEPHILRAHNYMLKGITDKYCPADSDRAVAWKTIGSLPEKMVLDWIRTHLRVTLPDSGRLPRV